MKFAKILALKVLLLGFFPSLGVADETLTCKKVLSNSTFRDALTRNDGRDFPVFAHDKEGHQLIGLACEKSVLDEHFLQSGWSVGETQERPDEGPFGPIGPPSNRHFADTYIRYQQCREYPVWQFWRRRCENSITFSTFKGVITHISAGGIK